MHVKGLKSQHFTKGMNEMGKRKEERLEDWTLHDYILAKARKTLVKFIYYCLLLFFQFDISI